MERKPKYYLNKEGEFIIENYHLAKPFSSFFPGIAGVFGVPIWVFYVNRGQAIASFGIKDKDHPMMEFQPANKSYQLASLMGFRTFIKSKSGKKTIFYDAFNNGLSALNFNIDNKMFINSYELRLKEINHTLGLETDIAYFTIPNDNYGALVRKLSIKNITRKKRELEILDGLPQIIPYGLTNMFLKKLARTVEAWMQAENLDNDIPFLRLKVDPTDRPEVIHVTEGNFYLAFTTLETTGKSENKKMSLTRFSQSKLIKPIVDPEEIFGTVSDFTYPEIFLRRANFSYPKNQLTRSKTPCCMVYRKFLLSAGESLDIYSLIGSMSSIEKLRANSARIANKEYLIVKQAENKKLICDLQADVFTHSSSKDFDFYCRQNFLDNVLRGGYPLSLEHSSKQARIHIYSRKHGDLERDYNKFLLEPAYFSQGNGNFRDINQNRRSDVWFNPLIKEESILTFFNLIQSDGYNPLIIKPDNFVFKGNYNFLEKFFNQLDLASVKNILNKPFTPGSLLLLIEQSNIKFLKSQEEFIRIVLVNSVKEPQAEHGEGFWIDHWTYCLDLLESYLGIYPENLKEILLERKEFTFYDNSEVVRPRSEKYALKNNRVFQLHAVTNNHAKNNLIRKRAESPYSLRTECGGGRVYKTYLIVKMLTVIANRFSSLDPCGVGVEMEADKPSWYDSLNGLPGLLGSSTCETFELKRWIIFLQDSLKKISLDKGYSFMLPLELHDLLTNLAHVADENLSDYDFWDKTHTLKESYRHNTLMGFSGNEKQLSLDDLSYISYSFLKRINIGLKKAYDQKQKLYYSYFINEVTDYQAIGESEHAKLVKPTKFKQIPLPLFLEAPMHYLRVAETQGEARQLFQALRKSALFDKKLKMYKLNASLKDMPEEIGRCRVFAPGWLENESIWLHMEYKLLLELLKNGLYKEFYGDFKNILIPFQNPARYGRSILENSSFLVSSAFPQKKLHGNGFVARLSGSTSEFINIWLFICLGVKPFYLDDAGKLKLELKPILPGWLFSQKEEAGFPKNTFAFKFLNKTLVVYHNPKRKDTFGSLAAIAKRITLKRPDKSEIVLEAPYIDSPLASDVRDGKFQRIDVLLG